MTHPFIKAASRKGFYIKAVGYSEGRRIAQETIEQAYKNNDLSILQKTTVEMLKRRNELLESTDDFIHPLIDLEKTISDLETISGYMVEIANREDERLTELGIDLSSIQEMINRWSALTNAIGSLRAIHNSVQGWNRSVLRAMDQERL